MAPAPPWIMREKLLIAAACHMIRFFLALTENRGVERSQNAPAPGNLRDWRPGASRHPCFLADLALSPAPAGSRQWLLPGGLAPQRCDRAYQALQDHLGAAGGTFQRLAALAPPWPP